MKSRVAVRPRARAEPSEAPGGVKERPHEPALRPTQCRGYMRKRLAEEFPGIVQGFLEGAKTGSCAHVKLVTELLAEPDRKRSRRKGSAVRLLEQLSG